VGLTCCGAHLTCAQVADLGPCTVLYTFWQGFSDKDKAAVGALVAGSQIRVRTIPTACRLPAECVDTKLRLRA
jgi:hypothetical protein